MSRPTPAPLSSDDVRWLLSAEAQPWLALAAETAGSLAEQIARLRARLSAQHTHLVIEQAALRQRAREKFRDAERMFFTSAGLEQATDQFVAEYKALRFSDRPQVFDLCSGIGGDLLALARRAPATGFDSDPVAAALAQANVDAVLSDGVEANMWPPARVRVEDVCQLELTDCAAWHIDPDRRPSGQRTTRVDLHEPNAAAIDQMLARNCSAAIKLAPAAEWPQTWNGEAEFEWIGRGRQCRQLVAWFGDLATARGQRRATVLSANGQCLRTLVGTGDAGQEPTSAGEIDAYLFEPDPAVLAAGLTGALAGELNLRPIAAGAVYLTGPQAIDDGALACFQVDEVLPFRLKPLKSLLRSRGIGRLEIKKRGVEHDPADVRRQLQLKGDAAATLLIARIDKRVIAVLAHRQEGN